MVTIKLGNFFTKAKQDDTLRVPPESEPPKKKKALKIALLVFFGVVLLVAVGAVGFLGFTGFSPDDRLIFNNIMVYGTNLGGMTQEEAKAAIHQMTDSTYSKQDMVLNVNGTEIRFAPGDTGIILDIDDSTCRCNKITRLTYTN